MRNIFSPDEIPIQFFYFGWKKALSYIKSDYGIYDPIEIENFNRNLHENLLEMRKQFSEGTYNLSSTLTYLLPKSSLVDENQEEKRRVRPMVQFSFRDQVAWATVMLVFSEWFDSNEEIFKRIPLHQQQYRKAYLWMVPWSVNNRIKRMFQQDELNGEMKRTFIHYSHKEMYESFQWSLRILRETRKKQFQDIRNKYGTAYYGEMDIREFYPSLKMKYVLNSIDERLKELMEAGIVLNESYEHWINLLKCLCGFEIDFLTTLKNHSDREAVQQLLKSIPYSKEDNKEITNENLEEEISKLSTFLKSSLPIGLIASGFLANCALTYYFDKRLDEYIKGLEEPIFVTRYTDDMMFISFKAENIVNIMKEAINLLNSLDLTTSNEKMKPNVLEEDDNILKKVPIVKKNDRIPGSTALIEKLSQFGEHKLWGMNTEQLKQYIVEMLNLLETKFDSSEIKDETKVSFAAWRLRCGTKEILNRKILYPVMRIKEALLDALARLPHKVSLIDYYVMHLFDISNRENILNDFKSLLESFKEKSKMNAEQETTDWGDHTYLRTRVMLAISKYWHLLSDDLKPKVVSILYDQLSNWFIRTPSWHEKFAMYWLMAVTGMNRDLGAVNKEQLDQESDCVKHVFVVYQCIQKNEEYLFKLNNDKFSPENVDYLKVVLEIFRDRKAHNRNVYLQEELNWLQWCWRTLKRTTDFSNDEAYQKFVFYLAQYCKEEIPVHGFKTLLHVKLDLNHDQRKKKFFYEVQHFLDILIHDWIDYPLKKKHVNSFLKALDEVLEESKGKVEEYSVINYACLRLKNLAWIKYYICKNKNGMSKLPSKVIDEIEGPEDIRPSLLDWLSVSTSQTLSKLDKLTHPLSEYEILFIINQCMSKYDGSVLQAYRLRNITISPRQWEKWRNNVIKQRTEPSKHKTIFETSSPISADIDPDWYYIKTVIEYVQRGGETEDVKHFKECFVFAVILTELLSKGEFNASAFDLSKILFWKGTQYVIERCHGPSSEITHLITDTINCFYLFYKQQYDNLGQIKLPYRAYLNGDIVEFTRFKGIIENVLNTSSRRYLNWNHGLLEVRVENIDSLIL